MTYRQEIFWHRPRRWYGQNSRSSSLGAVKSSGTSLALLRSWRYEHSISNAKNIWLDLDAGGDADLLFGPDMSMSKADHACIDLEKNFLRIQGREVSFLPKRELPGKARIRDPSPERAHPPLRSLVEDRAPRFGTEARVIQCGYIVTIAWPFEANSKQLVSRDCHSNNNGSRQCLTGGSNQYPRCCRGKRRRSRISFVLENL